MRKMQQGENLTIESMMGGDDVQATLETLPHGVAVSPIDHLTL